MRRARRLAPADAAALTASGTLALARHDFRGALRDGEAARRAAPDSTQPDAVLVDANVELGRYDAAATALQRMIDRQADARRLRARLLLPRAARRPARRGRGDAPRRRRRRRAPRRTSPTSGRCSAISSFVAGASAQRGARTARRSPSSPPICPRRPAWPGSTRRGAASAPRPSGWQRLVARLPLARVRRRARRDAARGRTGRGAVAGRSRSCGAQERLLRAAGVDTDVDLALFEAEHGDARRAVRLARAGWASAPSVRSADALAGALTRRRPRPGGAALVATARCGSGGASRPCSSTRHAPRTPPGATTSRVPGSAPRCAARTR